MIEEAVTRRPFHSRARTAVRSRTAWTQLLRFAVVGASGYAVNLLVFAGMTKGLGSDHRLAAVVAFLVAVSNNFRWNRHWTFKAAAGHAGFQAARFFTVSLAAFGFSLLILEVLVTGFGLPSLLSQAVALACATPLNFVGNRLWSFRH